MNKKVWLAAACLLAAAAASAQSRYQCRTASGTSYFSDRPCASQGIVYYGPAQATPNSH